MKHINKVLSILLLSPLAVYSNEEVCVYDDNYNGSKFVTYNIDGDKAISNEVGVNQSYSVILNNKSVLVIASAKTKKGDTTSTNIIIDRTTGKWIRTESKGSRNEYYGNTIKGSCRVIKL